METIQKILEKIEEIKSTQSIYNYEAEDAEVAKKSQEINTALQKRDAKKSLFDRYQSEINDWEKALSLIKDLNGDDTAPEEVEEPSPLPTEPDPTEPVEPTEPIEPEPTEPIVPEVTDPEVVEPTDPESGDVGEPEESESEGPSITVDPPITDVDPQEEIPTEEEPAVDEPIPTTEGDLVEENTGGTE